MTPQEAKEILQDWIDRGFEYESGYGFEALCDIEKEACKIAIMAIKALEQQPCEDCISRAEALRHSHIEYDDDGEDKSMVTENELFQRWLSSGFDDIYSFPEYMYKIKQSGVVIVES